MTKKSKNHRRWLLKSTLDLVLVSIPLLAGCANTSSTSAAERTNLPTFKPEFRYPELTQNSGFSYENLSFSKPKNAWWTSGPFLTLRIGEGIVSNNNKDKIEDFIVETNQTGFGEIPISGVLKNHEKYDKYKSHFKDETFLEITEHQEHQVKGISLRVKLRNDYFFPEDKIELWSNGKPITVFQSPNTAFKFEYLDSLVECRIFPEKCELLLNSSSFETELRIKGRYFDVQLVEFQIYK